MKRTHWLLTLKVAIGVALFVMLYRVAGAGGTFAILANAHDGVSVLFGLVLTVLGGFGAIIWMTSDYRRIQSSPAEGANVGEVRWGPLPVSADCIDGMAA
jgi:hypothetical protein